MQKNIKYFIWLVFIISYPAWGLILKQISNDIKTNYNSTGIIIYSDNESDLDIQPNTIKAYGYQESSELITSLKNDILKEATNSIYEYVDVLFALMPRKYGYTIKPSTNTFTDPIIRMNALLNKCHINDSEVIKEAVDNQTTQNDEINKEQSLINQKTAQLLKPFNDYLTVQNLAEYFNKEKTSQLSKSLVGSYGLFMPKNIRMLNKFNGYGRTLSSAVSVIDDLLLTENDFNIPNQSCITKNQFIELQFLILTAMEQAKTTVFIPECIARKDTGDIRLPIALINKVSLDKNTGQITVNLLFCNTAINNFGGFYDFIKARNSLLEANDLATEWEFIDYILELTDDTNAEIAEPNCSNSVSLLRYNFASAKIDPDGFIYHQTNNQYPEIADNNIQQNRIEKLNLSDYFKEKNSLYSQYFNDLLSTYDYKNNFINMELHRLITRTDLDNKIQQEKIIQYILLYNNNNIKDTCEHYQRKCIVQLDCGCDNFWNCHRCHNENIKQTTCNSNKMKALNIQKIKCLICTYEQDFNAETSHSCTRCKTKFSVFYCGKCKHFTGTEKNPYHCEKCGICRTLGDRSFHCDICGVCLDVQLKDNHKCREGSEHDECFICLEDAFTGCQLLPCSHKVHKECAQLMINNRIYRCPICRESFAHKLERKLYIRH